MSDKPESRLRFVQSEDDRRSRWQQALDAKRMASRSKFSTRVELAITGFPNERATSKGSWFTAGKDLILSEMPRGLDCANMYRDGERQNADGTWTWQYSVEVK